MPPKKSSEKVGKEIQPISPTKLLSRTKRKIDWPGWLLLVLIVIISMVSYSRLKTSDKVSLDQVWFYGWVTAVSTGLGVVPFFFFTDPDAFWMGVSNAVAGGMMISASYSLAYEGASFHEVSGLFGFHSVWR